MLKVPLQATNYPVNGVEHIEMWVNGEKIIEEAPLWPYFITLNHAIDWIDRPDQMRSEQIEVKPIDTLEATKAMKYSFPQVDYINKLNRNHFNKWDYDQIEYPAVEHNIRFLERVAIDKPDFFRQEKFHNTRNNILIFDIETLSKAKVYYEDVISISVSDGSNIWYEDVTGGTSEADLIEWFIALWKKIDPDHVIGYNHKRFDMPRIIGACIRNNIPLDWIGRDQETPNLTPEFRLEEGIIHGRCLFDVWEGVDSDQTLNGKVKNRKLKTVAPYFGIEAIEEELSDTFQLLQDPERLRKYNQSDVLATTAIYERYMYQSLTIANQLGYPYDEIVNPIGARKGFEKIASGRSKEGITRLIGTIIAGRGMQERGFVEAGKNRERFREIYDKRGWQGKKRLPAYQGAIVGLFRDGIMLGKDEELMEIYEPVIHSDYSGMYPSIQMEGNISPETVKLLDMEPYDLSVWPNGLIREKTEDHVIFVIPDKRLCGTGRNAIIWVDQSFESGFSSYLRSLKVSRDVAKVPYKAAKAEGNEKEKTKWYSVQYGLKVIGNACGYGSNVRPETRYGSLVVGILITGLARYMLTSAMDYIRNWK